MDWVRFVEDNHVDYVSRGPNTKRGEISIRCPWCGDDDPSHHLGISLSTDNWGCHRSPTHRGKAPHNLVRALLNCSAHQAKLIVGQYSVADPETLEQALTALTDTPTATTQPAPGTLRLPADFETVKPKGGTARYWRYLEERGFTGINELVDYYRLKACNYGRWKDRLILPVYSDGKLVNWTGRALGKPMNAPRYLSLSADEGAIKNIKDVVYDEDGLKRDGGRILFVVEGPIDCLKVDHYGAADDVRATCLFGTSISGEQIAAIAGLTKHFERTILLLDPEAYEATFSAIDWLGNYGVEVGRVPEGAEDPGAMPPSMVRAFIKEELKGTPRNKR